MCIGIGMERTRACARVPTCLRARDIFEHSRSAHGESADLRITGRETWGLPLAWGNSPRKTKSLLGSNPQDCYFTEGGVAGIRTRGVHEMSIASQTPVVKTTTCPLTGVTEYDALHRNSESTAVEDFEFLSALLAFGVALVFRSKQIRLDRDPSVVDPSVADPTAAQSYQIGLSTCLLHIMTAYCECCRCLQN